MLKIAGVILCISGATGYGILKITGWNQAVLELEQWILLFERMKNHICYRRDIITEICCRMGEEMYGIGGRYVASVGRELKNDRTKSFTHVWQGIMSEWTGQSYLSRQVKKIICDFPEYMGEQDPEQQINHLNFYIQRLVTEKEKLEKEISNKKKPVMAISLVSGITVSVLLI